MTEHQKNKLCKQVYTNESFKVFETQDIKVHLDGDVLVDWAHLARADVLVLSKSAFSNVPALLNPRCVIWQPSRWTPFRLSHWAPADGLTDERLARCLAGTAQTSATEQRGSSGYGGRRRGSRSKGGTRERARLGPRSAGRGAVMIANGRVVRDSRPRPG